MTTATLEEVEAAQLGLIRHAEAPAAKQWTAETHRLQEIKRLAKCIEYKSDEAEIDPRKEWKDVWCSVCEAIECAKGYRELAIKVYDAGWKVTDYKHHEITCGECQEKSQPESSYAIQYREGSGGTYL